MKLLFLIQGNFNNFVSCEKNYLSVLTKHCIFTRNFVSNNAFCVNKSLVRCPQHQKQVINSDNEVKKINKEN